MTKLTDSEKIALNTIRRLGVSRKNQIAQFSNLKWSTVTNCVTSLCNDKMIITDLSNSRDDVRINSEAEYFVGVSVGTSNIKVSIVDFSFSPISISVIKSAYSDSEYDNLVSTFKSLGLDYINSDNSVFGQLCFKTPEDTVLLSKLLSSLCEMVLKLKENMKIYSICFVFPGTVDYLSRTISKGSANFLPYNRVFIDKIFSSEVNDKLLENGIQVFVEHNVKAAIVAERELYPPENQFDCEKNLMLLYLGYGLGSSMILDNKLYRGDDNLAGQFGHMQIINVSDSTKNECSCGSHNCLEQYIREKVFEIDGPKFREKTGKELAEQLKKNPDKVTEIIKLLGIPLSNISKVLSVKKIIFSGKLSPIYEVIKDELNPFLIDNNISVELSASKLGEFSASMGAAICAYYRQYEMDLNWNLNV